MKDKCIPCFYPIPSFPIYDYIIVGAGSSGCALARVLLSRGFRVAILEKGNRQPDPATQIASNYVSSWLSNKNGITNQTEFNSNLNERIDFVYGTSVGGSSNINFLVAVQPSDDYLSSLASYTTFSQSQLKTMSDSLRTLYNIDSTVVGSGPINISQIAAPGEPPSIPIRTALTAAIATGLGVVPTPNYNNRVDTCVDPYIQNYEKDGIRSSAKILIPDATNNIFTNLEVDRLILDGTIVRGVEWTHTITGQSGRTFGREVILTAGVLETAQIMIQSGIVNQAKFKNHYGTSLVAQIDETLLTPWLRNGPIAFDTGIQIITTPRAYLTPCLLSKINPPSNVFSILGWILDSNVESTITQSNNGSIVIDCPIYGNDDQAQLENLVKQMYDIIVALRNFTPVTIIYPSESSLSPPYTGLYQQIQANPSITFHMYGSFPLGTALNNRFQYKGYQGLRICDLSASPVYPDGNTTFYAMLLGTACGNSI